MWFWSSGYNDISFDQIKNSFNSLIASSNPGHIHSLLVASGYSSAQIPEIYITTPSVTVPPGFRTDRHSFHMDSCSVANYNI